jgi:hypothetical protein
MSSQFGCYHGAMFVILFRIAFRLQFSSSLPRDVFSVPGFTRCPCSSTLPSKYCLPWAVALSRELSTPEPTTRTLLNQSNLIIERYALRQWRPLDRSLAVHNFLTFLLSLYLLPEKRLAKTARPIYAVVSVRRSVVSQSGSAVRSLKLYLNVFQNLDSPETPILTPDYRSGG